MAGIYNGHILEFPQIRIDCFTTPPQPPKQPWLLPDPRDPNAPPRPAPSAQLFLLTHVHTDHLLGLSDDFTGKILCSPDTKRMLLRLEAEVDRKHTHFGYREIRKRKYDGLRARTRLIGGRKHVVDMIETINVGETRDYLLGYECGEEVRVSITLLDANHCPGSSMFLITSPTAAVLHTGDIRADKTFMASLRRIPQLQQFFVPWRAAASRPGGLFRRLDRIYLDTSALFKGDMPEREDVLQELVVQMSMYPEDTVFFLDVWCFGWEYVVEEVARHFGSLVHVDRYKRTIYEAVKSDPFLTQCTTEDSKVTRFHACERWFRCDACKSGGKGSNGTAPLVVQVQMVEVSSTAWDEHQHQFLHNLSKAAQGEGPWPREIKAPLARHSLIPELRNLVNVFQPNALSPNTLVPDHQGRDFYVLPEIFKDVVAEGAHATMCQERDKWFLGSPQFGPAGLVKLQMLSKMAAAMSGDAGKCVVSGNEKQQSIRVDQQYRLLGSSESSDQSGDFGLSSKKAFPPPLLVGEATTLSSPRETKEEQPEASSSWTIKEEHAEASESWTIKEEPSGDIAWQPVGTSTSHKEAIKTDQPDEPDQPPLQVKVEQVEERKVDTTRATPTTARPTLLETKPQISVKREHSDSPCTSKRRRTAFGVNKSHLRSLATMTRQ